MIKRVVEAFKIARAVLTAAIVAAGVILAVASVYVAKKHHEAETFLNQIDLTARDSSGVTFYAGQKRLFVGQELGRDDVVQHLKSIGYEQSGEAGRKHAYLLQGRDMLAIKPDLAEFQPVTVRFRGRRIAGIEVAPTELNPTSGPVDGAAIEPESLGGFVYSIDGDDPMFVRRKTAEFGEFQNTDLFYAILASEDTTFLSHNGTRFDRILLNLLMMRFRGASSITSQVIKNAVHLDWRKTVFRKIDEIFYASALEHRMSKEKILTLYVNDVFLGPGSGSARLYGFRAAAEEYFGKSYIRDLSLSETAILVAMLPKPGFFVKHARQGDYSELTQRRDRVLRRLHENWPEKYAIAAVQRAQAEEVRFKMQPYAERPLDTICKSFIDYSREQQQLAPLWSLPPAELSGLHLYTSIDPDLMREGQRILSDRLPSLERRFPPLGSNDCGGERDRLLGAVVALDPQTGEIVAMSGGAGGKESVRYSKLALNALAAPASTIKPFWLVKALADGRLPNGERYTAGSIIDTTGKAPDRGRPEGPGRPRPKLASSLDGFADYTLDVIGVDAGKRFYKAVTDQAITGPPGQFALGFGAGTEVAPMTMARAYTIFGNGGRLVSPDSIGGIYLDGKPIELSPKPANPVIGAGAAFIGVQMMRSVLGYGPDGLRGTARQAFAQTGLDVEKIEIGGKTGSGPSAVWMVSVSPKLVTVVLLTYQCHSEIKDSKKMYARDTAALVWAEFIKSVSRFRPDLLSGSFRQPDDVARIDIDPAVGCRSNKQGAIPEFFIKGTEPGPCGVRDKRLKSIQAVILRQDFEMRF